MNQLHIATNEMINLQNKQMTVISLVIKAVLDSSEIQNKILHGLENLNHTFESLFDDFTTLFSKF
jgi:hypothetical protein